MGDTPKSSISLNPSTFQWWCWLAGRLVAVVVGLWVGVSFVAGHVFERELIKFHEVAKPEIKTIIVEELEEHSRLPAHDGVIERIHARETHDAAVDERLENMEEKLDGIDRKVDILIRNGRDHG